MGKPVLDIDILKEARERPPFRPGEVRPVKDVMPQASIRRIWPRRLRCPDPPLPERMPVAGRRLPARHLMSSSLLASRNSSRSTPLQILPSVGHALASERGFS